jgi:protein-S-isoprenylcysteine O-methyltransferase Ste14
MFYSKLLILFSTGLFFGTKYEIPGVIQPGIDIVAIFMVWFTTIGRLYSTFCIQKNEVLATSNIYSLVRNPLYMFSIMGTLGLSLLTKNMAVIIFCPPLYVWMVYFTVKNEERYLLNRYGEKFVQYKSTVPRLIPSFKNYNFNNESPYNVESINLEFTQWFWWPIAYLIIVAVR